MTSCNKQSTFEIDEPSEKTYSAIESAEKDDICGPFENVKELIKALNA